MGCCFGAVLLPPATGRRVLGPLRIMKQRMCHQLHGVLLTDCAARGATPCCQNRSVVDMCPLPEPDVTGMGRGSAGGEGW